MRIVQINCNGYYGSTGKLVRTVSDYLDVSGAENYIVCSGYGEIKGDDKTFFVSGKKMTKLNQVVSYLFGDAGFHFGCTTEKVIRLIEKLKPDLVHLHNVECFFINVAQLAQYLKKKNIPTVWTLHDCWPFTGHCTHFFSVGCNRWENRCYDCPQKKAFPYNPFFDTSKRLYERKKRAFGNWQNLHIANVSDWMQGIVGRSFLKNTDMRVIYNGIDLNTFSATDAQNDIKRKYGLNAYYIILSVASSWGEKKGFDKFIELSGYIGNDERIVLVGLTKEQIAILPKNVIGIEKIRDQKALCDYYRMADVYLNLSAEETFGLVSVEAMACGTPVISCNTTANPEIVSEDCGVILDEITVDNILTAIKEIRTNGKSRYSENCKKRVEENFSDEKMCREYLKYYRDVLNDKE